MISQYGWRRALNRSLFVFGILLSAYSVIFIVMFPRNPGAYFLLLIGAALFIYSRKHDKFSSKPKTGAAKFVRRLIVFGVCLVLTTFAAFCVSVAAISSHVPEPGRDAVIVLGAGLRGDTVSKTLADRLDAAAEYYSANPDVIIVVSGGQGEDEPVSEASAMKEYLIGRGIDATGIIAEDKSASTEENFKFSKKLLDDYFQNETYTSVYVTNEFHCHRAGEYAAMAGIDADFIPTRTPALMLPAYCARDYLATAYLVLLHSSKTSQI